MSNTRPRGRPVEELRRPKKVAIRDHLARCYHSGCYFVAGPYRTREETVRVAQRHWEEVHRRV